MKRNRFITLVMALSICSILMIPASAANGTARFTDVPADNWAYPYVEKAAVNGWITGYSDGRFGPNDKVTYAQFSVMLVSAFFPGQLAQYTGSGDAWYSRQCGTAAELGLFEYSAIKGQHTDGAAVSESLNRYEMAAILYPAFELAVHDVDANALSAVQAATPDWVSIPDSYKTPVAVAKTYGLINGVDEAGTFSGSGTMNRAQAAVVLCKLDELIQNNTSSMRKQATVIRVIDGDTIVVNLDGKEETVRLIGVDTPESVHPNTSKNTDAGVAASAFSKMYLGNSTVELEFDVQERDKYNRLLAYVYCRNGEMFNEKLLRSGYASISTYPPNVKYVENFEEIIKNRDSSLLYGEYDSGTREAPNMIYNPLADHDGLSYALLYADGEIVERKKLVNAGTNKDEEWQYVGLKTTDGIINIFNPDSISVVSVGGNDNLYNDLKVGDKVRLSFIYSQYYEKWNRPEGFYISTLKRYEEETPEVQSRTVYVTRTGKKYHFNGNCNGGKYYISTLEEAIRRGLTPCEKCAK